MFFDYRYGYNGIIPAVNESSLFYFIALSYLYYKKYILKSKLGLAFIVVMAALLLGTKAIYLYLILLTLFHFVRVSSLKAKVYSLIGIVFIMTSVWVLYQRGSLALITDYFLDLINKRGLFSALLSGRDQYFQTKFYENLEFWTPLNYFFGGQDQLNYLIEMDIFDLFLLFGFIGSVLYFVLLFNSFFDLNFKNKFNLFFVGSYLTLAAFGGHFFASALNAVYLVLFCLFVSNYDRSKFREVVL
jgi:hypothetical protein